MGELRDYYENEFYGKTGWKGLDAENAIEVFIRDFEGRDDLMERRNAAHRRHGVAGAPTAHVYD